MKALIIFNLSKTGAAALSARIAEILRGAGISPCVFGGNAVYAEKIGAEAVKSPAECNYIITVGGDGTILRWGKVAADYDIPLLGVNLGRLGFMASVETEEIGKIPELLAGEHHISRRMMLNVELIRDGKSVLCERALNDVTVSRSSRSKLPEFVVNCGETEVSRVRADGIILSTPTGSTAYSLSAGGPILSPELECVEFTALCPHTLFNRPMIFSDKQTISARVFNYHNSKATFSIDGGKAIPFNENDVLRLTRCPKNLLLIEAGEGFFGAIHNKLLTPLK